MKKKEIIIGIIYLIYIVLGCSYVFFPNGILNKVLSMKLGFAHLYSFSTLIGFIALTISILMIISSSFRNNFKIRNSLMNLFLVIVVIFSFSFIYFGVDNRKIEEKHIHNRVIKLVEWNVANNINEENIRDIFGRFDADIAVFPELEGYEKGDMSNRKLADLFKKANIDFEKYKAYISEPTEGSIAPVTIVIKRTVGTYYVLKDTPMTRFGTVYLLPTSENSPPIIGLHTAPPLIGLMGMWQRDLNLIEEIANHNKDSIIIGDFNATMKHGNLNDIKTHIDALEYASKFNSGTWNRNILSFFRSRIDHILIPIDKYCVKSVDIQNYKNSDHLCIYTEIQEIKR